MPPSQADTREDPPRPSGRRLELATGELEVRVTRTDLPLDGLCGFAARRNPKRGFLFVSKVLGRHLPARPSVMRDIHRRLAQKIPADLPGPVAVIGLAETAIGLGQGVHSRYLGRTGREDVLFIHTTRHRLDHPVAFHFLEEHSHASRHVVYLPATGPERLLLATARSVVLVDDEVSTGGTLLNLTRAFLRFNPDLERALCLTITDWRGAARAAAVSRAMPVPCLWRSLLEGEHRFTPRAAQPLAASAAGGEAVGRLPRPASNHGRLGRRTPPSFPPGLAGRLEVSAGDRILVLGSGELCYLPFRLAEALEEAGFEVYCQATTRSPALVGHAIRHVETFPDPGGDGCRFLYNVEPGSYDRVFFCRETSEEEVPSRLVETLGAVPLEL